MYPNSRAAPWISTNTPRMLGGTTSFIHTGTAARIINAPAPLTKRKTMNMAICTDPARSAPANIVIMADTAIAILRPHLSARKEVLNTARKPPAWYRPFIVAMSWLALLEASGPARLKYARKLGCARVVAMIDALYP